MNEILKQILLGAGGAIPLVGQIIGLVAPVVLKAAEKHLAATGSLPTNEQMQTMLSETVREILAEGEAWKAAHPKTE